LTARELASRPLLCLVLDRSVCTLPVDEAVRAAAGSGVDWIQVRERELDAKPLLELVTQLREIAREEHPACRLIVNRRIDVALASGADGAHLGFDALPVEEARALLGNDALIGISTHHPDEVALSARAGADYVHLAPIHAPKSKAATRAPLGVEALNKACSHGVAVIAQGGVEAEGAGELVQAGAAGIAVTGAILMSKDPGKATAALRTALDAG
jgi:thiamine-phosphate pyrophosphorylase